MSRWKQYNFGMNFVASAWTRNRIPASGSTVVPFFPRYLKQNHQAIKNNAPAMSFIN